MTALGWGIIGIGSIADRAVAPAITRSGHSRLVGVVSRDQGRADAFATKHGAELAMTSCEALLARSDVDVVYIATPNDQHPAQCIAAARVGKHVFCEKPLALTVEDVHAMLDACRQAGVKLGVSFQNRYHVANQQARELIREGAIGDVLLMQVEASGGASEPRGWRTVRDQAGAGTLYGAGPHPLDLLRFLIDSEATKVMAMSDATREQWVDRMMLILLRFENGAMAYCNANQTVPDPQCDLDVYGTKGRIVGFSTARAFLDGELRVKTAAGERSYPCTGKDVYDQMIDAFNRAIIEGREPSASGLDGLRSLELALAILQSAREGVLVRPVYS